MSIKFYGRLSHEYTGFFRNTARCVSIVVHSKNEIIIASSSRFLFVSRIFSEVILILAHCRVTAVTEVHQ